MAPVTMPPVEEAKSIFSELGYTVSGAGPELQAERKWRTVNVTAMGASDEGDVRRVLADGGREDDCDFRCFVTWSEYIGELRSRLRHRSPSYEWAIIGVESDAGYEVVREETPIEA